MTERKACPTVGKNGPCKGKVMLTADPDGVHRCRVHSLNTDMIAERRARARKAQKAHKVRKALAKQTGKAAPSGQLTAAEYAAAEAVAAMAAPVPDSLAQPVCVAAWIFGQSHEVPAETWPAPSDHDELVTARHRVGIALARGWLTDKESHGLHQQLTGIQKAIDSRGDKRDAQRGATVNFSTVRSREDAARLEVVEELEGAAT